MNLCRPTRYHVVCKATDQVMELDAATAEELRRSIETVEAKLLARGYSNVSHIVEFFGVAPSHTRSPAPAVMPAR